MLITIQPSPICKPCKGKGRRHDWKDECSCRPHCTPMGQCAWCKGIGKILLPAKVEKDPEPVRLICFRAPGIKPSKALCNKKNPYILGIAQRNAKPGYIGSNTIYIRCDACIKIANQMTDEELALK